MQIKAIIPETQDAEKRFLVEATCEELDAIRGAAGTSQVADRYKVGYELRPAATFRAASDLRNSLDRLRNLPAAVRGIAEVTESVIAAMEDEG